MADSRFFVRHGPFSLSQLAAICGGEVAKGVDDTQLIEDVGGLAEAQAGAVSFFQSVKYVDALTGTKASAVIVNSDNLEKLPARLAAIVADNPHKAYAQVSQAFYPAPRSQPGISPGAHIADTAVLGDGVAIAPGVVIDEGVEIGAGTYVGPNTTIATNVKIGKDCWIAPQVSLTHCLVGDRVTIHTGARIGQDGFGFAIGLDGHVSLPQLGRAILQDGCNIGANSCVDRGAGEDTVIGEGTFIDNQVQVGHNTVIGRHCAISGRSGISGSVTIGDYAVLGGGAGIADHVTIGVGAQVGAGTGVIRDVPPGDRVFGYPALPLKQFMRQVAMLKKMTEKKGK